MTHMWVKLNNEKAFPYNFRKQNIYDYHEINNLVSMLTEQGYECVNTYEGSLGSGNWICIAPDDEHYNIVVREIALNAWSSAHTIRRKRKLSKADLDELDRYYHMEVIVS